VVRVVIVDSLLNQSHKEMEIIIVVDGNEELYQRLMEDYALQDKIEVVALKENVGLSAARNAGIRAARGDAIAFFDDDAVAEKRWVQNLVDIYQNLDASAVGGKILPIWLSPPPDYFPDEVGWLVGIPQAGVAEEKVTEVRNTFGSNMSFRRDVFQKVGLFNEKIGFANRGASYMQGEEAEFTLRMKRGLGKGIIYNPEAVVYHKIPEARTKPRTLLRRAFYQGYSKALLNTLIPSPEVLTTEQSYLKDLLFKYIPRRLKGIFSLSHAVMELKKLSFLVAVILSVGLGFVWGYVKRG